MKNEDLYQELKKRHQAEVNSLPIKFAFSPLQLQKGMQELGLKQTDTDKVVGLGGGGFCLKTDLQVVKDSLNRLNSEMSEALKDDAFLIDALRFELSNHEYCVTYDPDDALEALGLGCYKDIKDDPRIAAALESAIEKL